jgi:hypothetical protein
MQEAMANRGRRNFPPVDLGHKEGAEKDTNGIL